MDVAKKVQDDEPEPREEKFTGADDSICLPDRRHDTTRKYNLRIAEERRWALEVELELERLRPTTASRVVELETRHASNYRNSSALQ